MLSLGKTGLKLMGFFSILGFSVLGHTHELPPARWVCSASELNSAGVTKSVLNVVFIPENANLAVIYANDGLRLRFQRYQNPLDQTWEIAISLHEKESDAEIVRAFAQEDVAVGLKKIDRGIGGYCRPNITQ